MSSKLNLSVRELELGDIDLLVNYWFSVTAESLKKMGAHIEKLPKRSDFVNMLKTQVHQPIEKKQSYALIWESNSKQIGHSNANNITFGQEATMHLHLWQSDTRKKGIGTDLLIKTLPFYFDKLNIKKLICEPYALNPAPNKTLRKVGFEFIKQYTTIPGSLNFEQEVNRWELTREGFQKKFKEQTKK